MKMMRGVVVHCQTAWTGVKEHAHAHEKQYAKVHHCTHLGYFGMIVTHGPYHYAALACLVLGLIAMVLHMEGAE